MQAGSHRVRREALFSKIEVEAPVFFPGDDGKACVQCVQFRNLDVSVVFVFGVVNGKRDAPVLVPGYQGD